MIFTKPINQLEIEDIKAFCEGGLKEGFILEYKGDFTNKTHRLERVICSFANTWGGTVLIGVYEDDEGKPLLPINGVKYEKGLDLRVTNTIMENIYPPVFVDKKVIRFENEAGEDSAVIVVSVPESQMTPHSCDQGTSVYVRTDERNKPYKRATVDRIEWLLDRRRKSEELKQMLYQDAIDRLDMIYSKPYLWWQGQGNPPVRPKLAWATFSAIPVFPYMAYTTVNEISDLYDSKNFRARDYRYGGTFPNFGNRKITQQGVIDYNYVELGKGLCCCELNIYGLFLYQEPLLWRWQDGGTSGGVIFCPHVIERLGQFLEIANKFYNDINFWGLIELKLKIDDIFSCRIRMHDSGPTITGFVSHQQNLEIERPIYKSKLETEGFEILKEMAQELCLAFNVPASNDELEEYIKSRCKLKFEQ